MRVVLIFLGGSAQFNSQYYLARKVAARIHQGMQRNTFFQSIVLITFNDSLIFKKVSLQIIPYYQKNQSYEIHGVTIIWKFEQKTNFKTIQTMTKFNHQLSMIMILKNKMKLHLFNDDCRFIELLVFNVKHRRRSVILSYLILIFYVEIRQNDTQPTMCSFLHVFLKLMSMNECSCPVNTTSQI